MSVPESRNLPSKEGPLEEGITEVEFSADDVKRLLRPRDSTARAATSPAAKSAKPAGRNGGRAWQLPAVVAAASIAALAGVGYLYAFAGKRAPAPLPSVVLELADPEPIVPSVKKLTPVGPIVRIKNPFDRHEVFEFPPGTSQAEARDAVAKRLMERAMERRALYSANTPRRRKSG